MLVGMMAHVAMLLATAKIMSQKVINIMAPLDLFSNLQRKDKVVLDI